MLNINNLSKNYGKLQVLDQVSIHIDYGESVALVGPNGSGKSTLIKSIIGLVKPQSGSIKFKDKIIKNQFEYKNDIGYMAQIGRYPDNLTPTEIIKFIQEIRNFEDKEYTNFLIQEFELEDHLNKKMRTLSGGTRQKVSVILTFMFDPELIILDEPTAGLDPMMTFKLKKLIKERNIKGKTIILVSHLIAEIDELCSRVIYLIDGKIVVNESIEVLKNTNTDNNLETAILNKIEKNKIEKL